MDTYGPETYGGRIAGVYDGFYPNLDSEGAVDGRYSLIFVAFNTLFALRTQDDQLRCFAHTNAHLADDASLSSRRSSPTSPASTSTSVCT